MSAENYCILSVEYPDKSSGSGLSTIEFDRLPEADAIAAIKSPPPELLARLKPGLFITARREVQRRTVVAFARGLRGRGKTALVTEDGCFVNGVRTQAGIGLLPMKREHLRRWWYDWYGGWTSTRTAAEVLEWLEIFRVSPTTRTLVLVEMWQAVELPEYAATDIRPSQRSEVSVVLDGIRRLALAGGLPHGKVPDFGRVSSISTSNGIRNLIYSAHGQGDHYELVAARDCVKPLDNVLRPAMSKAAVLASRTAVTFAQLAMSGMGYPQ